MEVKGGEEEEKGCVQNCISTGRGGGGATFHSSFNLTSKRIERDFLFTNTNLKKGI